MSDTTKLISAVKEGNKEAAKEAFNDVMKQKISDNVKMREVKTAQKLFKNK